MNNTKIIVSVCLEILHVGHIKILHRSKTSKDVYIGIDSDKRVKKAKDQVDLLTMKKQNGYVKKSKIVKSVKVFDLLKA